MGLALKVIIHVKQTEDKECWVCTQWGGWEDASSPRRKELNERYVGGISMQTYFFRMDS